jgi:beta-glucanase (GH16 family)
MRAKPAALLVSLAALAPALPAAAAWRLDYEEVFAHTPALNTGYWAAESGFVRNQELQYYTAANVEVRGGVLSLQARPEQVPNGDYRRGSGAWRTRLAKSRITSGSIVSRGTLLYGRVEVVARSPSGAGMWPAIWLVHESAGQYGELDVFEAVGKHPDTAFAGVHWGREPLTRKHRNGSRVVPGLEGRWHTHTVEWTPSAIRMTLDGQELFSFDPAAAAGDGIDPLRRPMRLHINLALGGTWGGPLDESRLPASFDIASIRIWSWQPGPEGADPVQAEAAPQAPLAQDAPPQLRWGR